MATEPTASFETSLRAQGTTLTQTTSDEFADAVADAVVEPAVGIDFEDPDLSYGDAPVTVDPTPDELLAAETGVTGVRHAVAAYGTLAVPSDEKGSEAVSLYPENHVAVVKQSQLLEDVPTLVDQLADEFDAGDDSLVLATGPSATGDMGALVYGVHGPKNIHVIVVSDK
ncbi:MULTISPECIES: LUD domain-containing protein [unclassified Haladaptatus]|uniref:LUD domain-containing protein n=1 Tax=unclassified Haladaptatus TaxID=2622732 RepID=UPI0023E85E11|nr:MULTISPECIES: LUD domain-containing protein [unclassified Haladaptatus]